jgi:NADH:ubiquinone oxidoreductase subunit F (NADH-binding)
MTTADDPGALPRLLAGIRPDGRPLSLREHISVHGPLPVGRRRSGGDALIDIVERSGLRGRGGAAFPTARKMGAVAAGRGRKIVVANGAEGEPASSKDAVLVTQNPHLVLDGAAVAAAAVGAHEVIVAVVATTAGSVTRAVAERTDEGVDRIIPTVVAVPEGFIAGEESALVDFLDGGGGLPRFVPPRPFERGIGGHPTLIQNVETLAQLALIARHGPDWFRAVGPAPEPGSTLVTLSGALARPGVYEVARGTRIGDLIDQVGGPTARLQAFLLGGYAGAWLPADVAWRTPLSEDGLRAHGAILGAGVVIALSSDACGIAETATILAYMAAESAGQCGPCVHGLPAIAQAMGQLARGNAHRDVIERLGAWTWQVTGRGACHHPDGAARLATSALATFASDIADHRRGLPCLASGHPHPSMNRARRR